MTPDAQAEADAAANQYLRELRDGRLAYKPAEAARLLGLDERTVQRLIAAGVLPAVKHGSRLTLISRAALYDFLGLDLEEHPRAVAR